MGFVCITMPLYIYWYTMHCWSQDVWLGRLMPPLHHTSLLSHWGLVLLVSRTCQGMTMWVSIWIGENNAVMLNTAQSLTPGQHLVISHMHRYAQLIDWVKSHAALCSGKPSGRWWCICHIHVATRLGPIEMALECALDVKLYWFGQISMSGDPHFTICSINAARSVIHWCAYSSIKLQCTSWAD